MSDVRDPTARRVRQKKILMLLGCGLIAGGLVILIALQRMPPPLRILVGLTDIVAGLTLLVVARQKF
jgi:xanthosine utilization system XapX-like protein